MRYLSLAAVVAASLLLAACSTLLAAEPGPEGEIQIVLEDYDIDPDVIRLKAGQQVRMVIVNRGTHLHELMIGREVEVHEGITEGFAEDFFAGIQDIQVEGPGMVMGLPGMEMEGMDMGGMEGMDGAPMGDEAPDMAMDEEPGHDEGDKDPGHDEAPGPMAGEFGPLTLANLADEHAGLMVMIDPRMVPPDQATVLTFTVPEDKVGRWELGCFQERGQHYDDGMKAVLIVEP